MTSGCCAGAEPDDGDGNSIESNGITLDADVSMERGKYIMYKGSQYIDVRPTNAEEEYVYNFTDIDFINNYKRKPGNNGTNRVEYVLKLNAKREQYNGDGFCGDPFPHLTSPVTPSLRSRRAA